MTEHLLLNHEASPEMSEVVTAFGNEHGLEGDVELAKERIDEAAHTRAQIIEALPVEEFDTIVADFVHDSVETAEPAIVNLGVEVGVVELAHEREGDKTAFELDSAPIDSLAAALKDLEAIDPDAVEDVIHIIEAAKYNNPKLSDYGEVGHMIKFASDPTQKARALRVAIDKDTSHAHLLSELGQSAYTNKEEHTSRVPLSLPMRDSHEAAIVYANPEEMRATLEGYGVDENVIDSAEANGWNVPVGSLPEELRKTILAARIQETVAISHDQQAKERASERNANITLEDIWQPSTLHHVTQKEAIRPILENGQTGYALINGVVQNTGGVQNGNLNFGITKADLPPDATNQDRMNHTSYSQANGRGADVYIHYVRNSESFRAGEEYTDGGEVGLISGGLPSTEISAMMMRRLNDIASLEASYDAILEAGFYIPIFDADGTQLFSKEDFDKGVVPEVIAKKRELDAKREAAAIEGARRQQEFVAAQAASKGMTIEEYNDWYRGNLPTTGLM